MDTRLALITRLHNRHNLVLPSDFNLYAYCCDFCHDLASLYYAATRDSVGQEWIWNGSDEQIELIRRTPVYCHLYDVIAYAEFGLDDALTEHAGKLLYNDNMFLECIEWIKSIDTLNDTHYLSFDINIIKYMLHKFLARYKLDGHLIDHDSYVITGDCAYLYLPMKHPTGLNLFEVALLAGVSSIRTIRNATYDKSNPLQVVKEGHTVYVEINEARRWLQGRRGFVPTPGINYGEAV